MINYRIRAVLAIFFLFALATSSDSQSASGETGKLVLHIVRRDNNIQIPFSFVYIHNYQRESYGDSSKLSEDVKPTVDELGRAEVSLPPTYYDVFVSSPGYEPSCQRIYVWGATTTEVKVDLKEARLDLEP